MHSTQVIAGVVFILLGISFILLQGTNSLAGIYEGWGFTELSFDADVWVRNVTDGIPDALLFAIAGVVAAAIFWYVRRRLRASGPDEEEAPSSAEAFSERDGA